MPINNSTAALILSTNENYVDLYYCPSLYIQYEQVCFSCCFYTLGFDVVTLSLLCLL